MPAPLRAMDFEVGIEYGQFLIEDTRSNTDHTEDAEASLWTEILPNVVRVLVPYTGVQYVAVRLERWAEQPEIGPPEPFAEPDEGKVELSGGSVTVSMTTEGFGPPFFEVGAPGTYAYHAYRHGAEETLRLRETQDEIVHGVERCLIRFWPAGPVLEAEELAPAEALNDGGK